MAHAGPPSGKSRIALCNEAVGLTAGEVLVFLSPDAVLLPGWRPW